MKYALCIETIFAPLTFPERLAATREHGYNAVEIWGHGPERLPAIRAAVSEGLEIAMTIGARGFTNPDPAFVQGELANLRTAIDFAREVGCPNLCLFVGDRNDGALYGEQRAAAVDFLGHAADVLAGSGVTGIVESLNGKDHPRGFLNSMREAVAILSEVDRPEIKLQFDVYHTALTDADPAGLIAANIANIAYFQAADAPGRGEPGTGKLDYTTLLRDIKDAGFNGYFSWEYIPQADVATAIAATRAVQV